MAILSQKKIQRFLSNGRNGNNTSEQGRALEDLVCYIFSRVPGISVTHRNVLNTFQTEEIDVALWNEKLSRAFDFLPNVLLVEAKNWSHPVGSNEVAWFDRKLQDRGLDIGILVALSGITGNTMDRSAAHQIIAGSLREFRRIIIVTGDDINSLLDTKDIVIMLKTKLCELAVTGTVLP